MLRSRTPHGAWMLGMLGALLCLSPAAQAGELPPWAQVQGVVERYLKSNSLYAAGDLLAQADIEPIFNELLRLGFRPAEHEELYDAFLPENNYLVGLLRTPAGRQFMRKVSANPQAYDRLERLAWFPKGRKLLDELMAHPDGAAHFQQLNTSDGAKAIVKLLGDDPRAQNFMLATGHIHTADQLLKHLRQEYDRQTRKAAK